VAEYRPPANSPSPSGSYPLRLLTLKRHYSINSSYGSLPVMLQAEPEQACQLNPIDADRRMILDGDRVLVQNDVGSIHCTAAVTDKVPEGTVTVPFGRWSSDPDGGGANTLTSDLLGDLANGPTFCDNLVEVVKLEPRP
jgi:anaerobic selenocysteine-containing dehydrogenase